MKLKLTVEGNVYEVDVEVAEPQRPPPGSYLPIPAPAYVPGTPPSAAPLAGPAPGADEGKVLRTPFAGVVVRVAVQAGQTIQPNDVLLVLEAMKMETLITAPRAGRVAKVNVKLGDAVQSGQLLVEFE